MMTEPVAYVKIKDGKVYSMLRTATPNDEYTPVYTAEQLHSRVKMTHTEFETIKAIKQKYNLLSDALNSTAFFGDEKQQSEKQIEFANLFINLDLNNPEETIEIVPNMKWFVRSKKKDVTDGDFEYLSKFHLSGVPSYRPTKRIAAYFNTKEQAELWTNPLTEAVQLPVEDER